MCSQTSRSCRRMCWTRFRTRDCAKRRGTRTRWATGRFGSSRTNRTGAGCSPRMRRSEEHTSELQSRLHLVCRLLLEKKKKKNKQIYYEAVYKTIPQKVPPTYIG